MHTAALIMVLVGHGSLLWAQDFEPQKLEWNAFIGNWQLLGPFSVEEGSGSGLGTEFMPDEGRLQAGHVGFYDNKLYTWVPHQANKVEFRAAYRLYGSAANNQVAYAYSEVVSPVDQKAILAIAHDDGVVAWVNGVEVARADIWTGVALDNTSCEVDLRAGVNSVLLKVSQGDQAWQFGARFRPSGLTTPLFSFRGEPGTGFIRLPTVVVDLFAADGQIMSTHKVNGAQESWPGGAAGYYSVYAPAPGQQPVAANFSVRSEGYAVDSRKFSWDRIQSGDVVLQLRANRPVELQVIDANTKQPIAGAEIWDGRVRCDPVTDAQGRVSLPDFSPVAWQCTVRADGYAATVRSLSWPRQGVHQVALQPAAKDAF
jgi:hypothetical protein